MFEFGVQLPEHTFPRSQPYADGKEEKGTTILRVSLGPGTDLGGSLSHFLYNHMRKLWEKLV